MKKNAKFLELSPAPSQTEAPESTPAGSYGGAGKQSSAPSLTVEARPLQRGSRPSGRVGECLECPPGQSRPRPPSLLSFRPWAVNGENRCPCLPHRAPLHVTCPVTIILIFSFMKVIRHNLWTLDPFHRSCLRLLSALLALSHDPV